MPEQQQQQTPTQTSTANANTTSESTAGNQTNAGRGRGNNRSYSGRRGRGGRSSYRERRSNNLQTIMNSDRDFEGKVTTIGIIGLPNEQNLRYGLQLDDFNESVMTYIGTNWDKAHFLKCLLMNLERPEKYLKEPSDTAPNKDTDAGKYDKWKLEVQRFGNLKDNVEDLQVKLYNLVLGQCTPSLVMEIRGDKKFTKKDRSSDVLWLLKTIKKIMSGVTLRKNETLVYCNMVRELLNLTQGPTETLDTFVKRLTAKIQTVELAGGLNFFFPDLKNIQVSESEDESSSDEEDSDSEIDELDSEDEVKAKTMRNTRRAVLRAKAKTDRDTRKAARVLTKATRKQAKLKKMKQEMVKSMILMQQADRMRHGARYDEMDRATDLDRDEFPRTFNQTVEMLSNTQNRLAEQHNRSQNRYNTDTGGNDGRGSGGATFAQVTGRGSGRGNGGGDFERRAPMRNAGGQYCIPTGEQVVPGRDNTIVALQCYTCGSYGHTNQNNNCPTGTGEVSTQCVNSVTFNSMISDFYLKNTVYLLDSAATHSTVKSKDRLTNLTTCNDKDSLFTLTNAGSITFTSRGALDFLPLRPHYNADSVANILALHEVNDIDGAYVRFMGDKEDAFYVIFQTGRMMKFIRCYSGLYYYDIEKPDEHEFQVDYCFIQTSTENEKNLSEAELERLKLTRYYQELFAWPSKEDLVNIIEEKQIKNAKIEKEDIIQTEKVLGKAKAEIRGKMKRQSPTKHKTRVQGELPDNLKGREIELYTDVYTASKCSFLITKAGSKLNHFKSRYLKNKKMSNVTKIIKEEIERYEDRGFKVTAVHADNAFDNDQMRESIGSRILHIYAREEHVGVIERQIRSLKERLRSVIQGLPYKRYPKLMFISMITHVVEMMNRFVNKNGLSSIMSPAELVEGVDKLDMSKRQILFGSYAEVWDGTTNTMKERSVPCIALNRSNDAGGFYFMCLETGKRHNSNQWTELPVTEEIIQKVENLTKQKVITEVVLEKLNMELVASKKYNNDDDATVETVPMTDDEQSQEDSSNSVVEVEDVHDGDEDDGIEEIDVIDGHHVIPDDGSSDDSELIVREEDVVNDLGIAIIDDMSINENDNRDLDLIIDESENSDDGLVIDEDSSIKEDTSTSTQTTNEEINDNNINNDMNDTRMSENKRMNENEDQGLRRSKRQNTKKKVTFAQDFDNIYGQPQLKPTYGHSHFQNKYGYGTIKSKYTQACSFLQKKIKKEKDDYIMDNYLKTAVNTCFASMHASKGIKKHGERAVAMIIKELKQLNDGAVEGKPVVEPISMDSLNEKEKQQALDAVTLIEEKRDERLKARCCADGSKQKYYLEEYESVASPTVGLESLMTTLMIGVHEGRKMISFDVPGAFLQAEMSENKLVLLKLKGQFAEMMCEINPEHRKNLHWEVGKNGKKVKVLYMRVLRAIYGCIEAALQWYLLFTQTLKDMGFELNPYDKCIANRVDENGKQCTIAWHVDDCIATHVDQKVLDHLGKKMIHHFGDMEIHTGNEHDFLGMKLVINEKEKTIAIDMREQIRKMLEEFEEETGAILDGTVSTPATGNLFKVDMTSIELDGKKSKVFHTNTAKLLYIMKRARPDIETSVSYLMRRVSKSDNDDWLKLRRTLGFLKGTINDVRKIGARTLTHLFTWVDASYAVHDNMRSHMGGLMSMGIGLIHAKSSMNKINTKSTTEAELVSLGEYLPYNIWFMHFMEAQGYKLRDNVIYQDNKSAILMEKNGRNSCTGNSRHINVRYFWIKDKVDQKEVRVEYTPTYLMLADYFTKPLMGALFIKLREYIMGWKPISDLIQSVEPTRIKEDVEICEEKNVQ